MKALSKIARNYGPGSTEAEPVKQGKNLHADSTGNLLQSRLGYSPATVPTFATNDTAAKSLAGNASYRSRPRLNIQPKLMVGAVNDPLEMEADRVADQVMRMPEPHSASTKGEAKYASGANLGVHSAHAGGKLKRRCGCGGSCDDCQKKQHDDSPVKVQMKAAGVGSAQGMEAPAIVHEVLRSSGRPLDSATRAFMEPRFGHDFSHVRIHTDAKAAESAKAVGAKAYAVGNDVVFGAGEYGPRSTAGQSLLGHELAHVVQQGNSGAAVGVQRKASPEDQKKHDAAVEFHKKQQKQVADLLIKAGNIKRDPAKGPLDANNLYANTAELLNNKKMILTVLTPTHYFTWDKPFYFDDRVHHDKIQGDYEADPKVQFLGTISPPSPGTLGRTMVKKNESDGLVPMPPKEENVPDPIPYNPKNTEKEPKEKPKKPTSPVLPAMQWLAAEVQLFIPRTEQEGLITEAELRNTFVHEGQHVADLNYLQPFDFEDWHSVFDRYTSEFRAFWLQPPTVGPCSEGVCLPGMGNFPASSPIDPSEKQDPITLPSGQDCKSCAPKSTSATSGATSKTPKMKDERQNSIFRKLLSTDYAKDRFACFYVCDQNFSDAVDAYSLPAGENVANSSRLMDLRVELQSLAPKMTRAELDKTKFVDAIKALDELDWAFLKDRQVKGNKGGQLSEPLWKLLNKAAPKVIVDAMISVVDKKNPVNEIGKALDAALTKIK